MEMKQPIGWNSQVKMADEKKPHPITSLGRKIYAIMVLDEISAFYSISSAFGVNPFLWS
jgi:hypothetical protein